MKRICAVRERISTLAAACIVAAVASAACAAPLQTTRYVYYPVTGDNLVDLYASMLRGGPHVGGAKAYATTTASSRQDGKLIQEKSCRVENYQVKIDFVIRLPRLADDAGLNRSERHLWRGFASYLKRHEENHRSIWLACAADLERRVKAIKARTCNAFDARAQALWTSIRVSCDKRHLAFDTAEQRRLLQQPFFRTLISRARQARAAPAN
jgi:predicted secreted Zn-dependent protease